jgi:hypothetical protein
MAYRAINFTQKLALVDEMRVRNGPRPTMCGSNRAAAGRARR